ncbi:MAG TPA: hypothetical protein VGB33_00505 [Acidimicrobiia bacterium]
MALLLLDALDLTIWAILVTASGLVLALILSSTGPRWHASVDGGDLFAVIALYAVAVALFRLAFVVFTTDNVWGLFLAFAGGLVIGVVGPIIYQVWLRGRDLESLGVGLHRLPETMVVGLIFGFAQFSMTMWGYRLPEAEAWVPLLVLSLVVGFFEAVFFPGVHPESARGKLWHRSGRGRRSRSLFALPRRIRHGFRGDVVLARPGSRLRRRVPPGRQRFGALAVAHPLGRILQQSRGR